MHLITGNYPVKSIFVISSKNVVKGTVMQIDKALITDRLRVWKVSWKFYIPTINNFAVIYPGNLLFC